MRSCSRSFRNYSSKPSSLVLIIVLRSSTCFFNSVSDFFWLTYWFSTYSTLLLMIRMSFVVAIFGGICGNLGASCSSVIISIMFVMSLECISSFSCTLFIYVSSMVTSSLFPNVPSSLLISSIRSLIAWIFKFLISLKDKSNKNLTFKSLRKNPQIEGISQACLLEPALLYC